MSASDMITDDACPAQCMRAGLRADLLAALLAALLAGMHVFTAVD